MINSTGAKWLTRFLVTPPFSTDASSAAFIDGLAVTIDDADVGSRVIGGLEGDPLAAEGRLAEVDALLSAGDALLGEVHPANALARFPTLRIWCYAS